MRLIRKGPEPGPLLAYRKTPGAAYLSLPTDVKAVVRGALVRDQHGLCCFCMQRIEAAVAPELKVKIAHWMPRSVDASRQLFWTNLYAACPGNEGAPFEQQHCDTRQRDTVLKLSPGDPTHVASLSYTTRGEIRTSRDDLRADLDVTLNLNDPAVCARRRSAVFGMANALGRRGGGAFAESEMRVALTEATTPNARGELPPFAGVLEWWLRRRLAPAAAT